MKPAHLPLLPLLALTLPASAQEFSASLDADYGRVVNGGIQQQGRLSAFMALAVSQSLSHDTRMYGDLYLQRGRHLSDLVGDLQGVANIDAADTLRLGELWLQTTLSQGLSIKVGRVDANSEFAHVQHAGEFINSSMGYSPTIGYLPSYPAPRLSGNIIWQSSRGHGASLGIYANDTGSFSSPFIIGEYRFSQGGTSLKGGLWQQSDARSLDGRRHNSRGIYGAVSGDHDLALFNSSGQGWYAQLGLSDKDELSIDKHLGAGMVWYAPLGRKEDSLGLGLSHITTSEALEELAKNETAVEFFYRYQLSPGVAIKPDLQWIINPASQVDIANALVFTLRLSMDL